MQCNICYIIITFNIFNYTITSKFTECIDFDSVYIKNINDNYQTKCDPRLNGHQSISLITSLCDYILKSN